MDEILDAAIALINAFHAGDITEFNREANQLAMLTGRAIYAHGWEQKNTLKNLADGIVMREAIKGAGNSGTH